MVGLFAVAALFSSARGLILSNIRSSKDSGLEAEDIAKCPDISGTYESANGKPLTVTQTGCALSVMWYEHEHNKAVYKTGTVDGASVSVKDFDKPGRVSEGDVFFGDGGHWKRTGGQDTTILSSGGLPDIAAAAAAVPSATAGVAAVVAAVASGYSAVADYPAVVAAVASTKAGCPDIAGNYTTEKGHTVAIYQNGCFMKVKMESEKGLVILPGYMGSEDMHVKEFKMPGLFASNGDITFADGGIWKKLVDAFAWPADLPPQAVFKEKSDNVASSTVVEQRDKMDDSAYGDGECPDIHGKFVNDAGEDVTVYQIGCFVKVKMYWNEKLGSVLKPGHIVKTQLVIKDFTTPGFLNTDGDVVFQDGGSWKKAQAAGATSLPVSEVGSEPASEVGSEPASDMEGQDITEAETLGSVEVADVKSVEVEDDSITKSEDSSTDWTPEVFEAPDESECKDIHGSYLDKKGKTVNIDQTGCDLRVKMFWSEERGEVTVTGSARNNELSMEGISTNGHFAETGDVFFSDGGHWFKQGPVTTATQEERANLSSIMADESADTAVMREGTSDTASAEAAESLEGAQSPEDAPFVYVEDVNQSAQDNVNANLTENMTANMTVNASVNTSVNMTVNTAIQAIVNDVVEDIMADLVFNETKANSSSVDAVARVNTSDDVSSLSSEDQDLTPSSTNNCADVHGKYTSMAGQEVMVYQVGCFLKVKMHSNDEEKVAMKSGRIVDGDLRVQDIHTVGKVTAVGDIFFTDGDQWMKSGQEAVTLSSDVATDSSQANSSSSDALTSEATTQAVESGDCSDVHGKYTNDQAQEISINQDGCALYVTSFSPDMYSNTSKPGKIVGEIMRVQDCDHSGMVTSVGDIFFGDGQQWKKVRDDLEANATTYSGVPNSAIVNTALANSTGNLSDTAMSVEATYSDESNTTFANASAANTSSANTTFANASANTTTWANASELNISLNSTLSSTSSVVQPAGANEDEDFLVDQDCPDVSGAYQTTQGEEVTVYQIGCYLKVKMPGQEELTTLKSGKILGNFLYVKDVEAPGIMTLSGDVLFGNGGDWKKKYKQLGNSSANQSSMWNETATKENATNQPNQSSSWNETGNGSANASLNGSANASVNSNDTWQTLMTLGSRGTLLDFATDFATAATGTLMDTQRGVQDQCPDVSGHYLTSVGKLITMAQSQCNLDVQLWWDNEHGEVLTKGTVTSNDVQIDGFLEKGQRTDESITFPAGAHWRKVSATDLAAITKDGCSDVSGSYGDQSGSVVTISQIGCHAAIKAIRGSTETRPKLGHVAENELRLFDHSTPGRRMQDGSLDFGASAFWGKLTDEQAAKAAQDDCVSTDGHYRDSKGDTATITQEQCHVEIQMKWDGETGNVTLGGHIFGDSFFVKEFHSSGLVAQPGQALMDSSIEFDGGAVWHKMSNEEAIALSIPEAGCDNFEGSYVDNKGKKAAVIQKGCHLNVNMWWNDVLGNVALEGHVSRGTMRLPGLDAAAISEFGIRFGDDQYWTRMQSAPAADASVTATAVSDPIAVRDQPQMTSVSDPLVQSDEPQMTGDTEDEMMDIQPLLQ